MIQILRLSLSILLVMNAAVFSPMVNAEGQPMADRQGDCRPNPDCKKADPKEHMKRVLALREDQVEAVMAVLKASHEQRMSLHDAGREQHKALHEQTLQQLEPLLDEEQMVRFKRFAEGMKQKHQPRMGGNGREGH